ncbi:TRAP transporter small permease [Jiella sp. MQZ9-1]|uniref:TRAP transporter small permease protein n=1 Tax=Jiella flava TaxID=2816857 RepID=A0A939FTU1_9HYPH|nr:TRAP transporter small permease [Jiella flava]MBO0661437.1 TRAP transporter small permease [Jiella flava]MCD2470080.1 TRAP transporter small permease [Jiella flava]
MRRALETLYRTAGWLAALCLVAILVLVSLQIGARLLDWALTVAGAQATGFSVPGLAQIGGFLLGASTFLALADTLAKNVHIRVDLATQRLPARLRQIVDGLVALLGAALSGFATYALAAFAMKSFAYGDVSYGLVATPLVIPQGCLAFGLLVFTIALIDEAVLAFQGEDRIQGSGESI